MNLQTFINLMINVINNLSIFIFFKNVKVVEVSKFTNIICNDYCAFDVSQNIMHANNAKLFVYIYIIKYLLDDL